MLRKLFFFPLLCLTALYAQEPALPNPVFSVSTTLVQIDSVVTDSHGHTVTNLKPEDFAVTVDGKPQTISNFSYIHLDSPDINRPSLTPQALGKPLPSANTADVLKPEDVRRSLVLVVDDLSLSFTSIYYVRRALHKFIDEQMQPGDLVALWETGRNNSVFQQFTSDKRVLGAAVDGIRWNPRGLGLVDPFESVEPGIQLSEPGRDSRNRQGVQQVQQRSDTNTELEYIRLNTTSGALDTLAELMDELRPVGGRKAVVFFSDGIYLPGITIPGKYLEITYEDALVKRFRKLIDKANRSGAVVYTVDARGLLPLAPEKLSSLNLSQAGLIELAEDTGGFAAVNTNGITEALQHLEDEQTGYYLIGFKAPENISTGGPEQVSFHSIKVKVNVHGLHAHSRSGFFGETDEAARPKYVTRQQQMFAAVQSLFNKSDLHVRTTALYRRTAKGQTFVHNLLYIDPRDITFRTDLYGVHYAALDVYLLASGSGIDPLAAVSRHITINANDEKLKKLQADGLLFEMDVPVKQPGPYQVRACVLDSTSRAAGSAGQYIDIPDLKKQRLALTTPLMDDAAAPADTRFNTVSSALREFHAGTNLAFAFRIETGKNGAAQSGKYDTRVQLYRDRTPVLANPVPVTSAKDDSRNVGGELRLGSALAPGQYYLQAMATDSSAKTPRTVSSWTEFQVVQ